MIAELFRIIRELIHRPSTAIPLRPIKINPVGPERADFNRDPRQGMFSIDRECSFAKLQVNFLIALIKQYSPPSPSWFSLLRYNSTLRKDITVVSQTQMIDNYPNNAGAVSACELRNTILNTKKNVIPVDIGFPNRVSYRRFNVKRTRKFHTCLHACHVWKVDVCQKFLNMYIKENRYPLRFYESRYVKSR